MEVFDTLGNPVARLTASAGSNFALTVRSPRSLARSQQQQQQGQQMDDLVDECVAIVGGAAPSVDVYASLSHAAFVIGL